MHFDWGQFFQALAAFFLALKAHAFTTPRE